MRGVPARYGGRLGWLKDVQQVTVQGIGNHASAVDTRLVKNAQRNNAREAFLGQLCATMANLNTKLDNNIQETQQMKHKYIATQQRMGEMSKGRRLRVGKVSTQRKTVLEKDSQ